MNASNEPVALGGVVTAVAVAAIPFLRSFGVDITQDQSNATLGLLAALIVAGTFFVRSRVTPVERANDRITEAFHATPGVDEKPTL